ncbi:hypothetical protein [Actinomadura opuntiae]|uniref:hypothetical protein n=1 Tax=Actinomadura sp. OS1-43 TaxID=604315 RepID=UPI00255AF7B9|nr:hypothetical protein [Actinomadura sp. OS1-43]MDL4815407.1 hypothetical protein [Actinomadura sp. OS1-43]
MPARPGTATDDHGQGTNRRPDKTRTSGHGREAGAAPPTAAAARMRAMAWSGMRVIMVGAGIAAAGTLVCGLTLTSIGCAVFGLAYLLQGTWGEGLGLLGVYALTGTPLVAGAWLAKRRTARARAKAAATVTGVMTGMMEGTVTTVTDRASAVTSWLHRPG